MSSIVDFRLIYISKLSELRGVVKPRKGIFDKENDHYFNYLRQNSIELKENNWTGYIYATLLSFLEEKGINLMQSDYNELSSYISNERRITCFVFTNEHKLKYLEMLDPSYFNKDELGDFYNDFNDNEEDDFGNAMFDGIKAISSNQSVL